MSVLTFAVAASSASADNPTPYLSCKNVRTDGTSVLEVTRDAQGAFHFDAFICQPDPQGSAYDVGPCTETKGDLLSSGGSPFNTGFDSDVTLDHVCAGLIAFYDRTTGTQIDFARSECQSN